MKWFHSVWCWILTHFWTTKCGKVSNLHADFTLPILRCKNCLQRCWRNNKTFLNYKIQNIDKTVSANFYLAEESWVQAGEFRRQIPLVHVVQLRELCTRWVTLLHQFQHRHHTCQKQRTIYPVCSLSLHLNWQLLKLFFNNCTVLLGFLPWEIQATFPRGKPAVTGSC